ncbi:AraC family transcriptional regulator [Bradyrhizobium sp. UFLA03-84]|uniref:AraC family transcriptional regulator n=1 Tax=Bradyrhizobium sp. UFLA03-84 TaxID=418599 RepID=UPI0024BF3B8E|nr:AraC family transcriptional regulator [Bradyrhizobium sp. UFLA03-84]
MPNAPDVSDFRYSTADWAERERLAIFRERIGRMMVKLDPAPLINSPYYSDARVIALHGLGIGFWTFANLRVDRTRELLDGCDDLLMVIGASGNRLVSHRGREQAIGAGEAVLMATAETATMTYPSSSNLISLRVPRKALTPLVRNPEDVLMRPLTPSSEALRLLTRYVRNVDDLYRSASAELQRLVVSHLIDLAALVIGATGDGKVVAEKHGLAAARLAAVKADVGARIGECSLSLTAVAKRQKITPRQIQRLFAGEGTTFSEFVLDQRLARAHGLLVDPRRTGRSISTIAFEAGFGDLSYFNRAFRRRYNARPSDIRIAPRRF